MTAAHQKSKPKHLPLYAPTSAVYTIKTMPHPLEQTLDESFHRRPPVRRRSSLDNSGLTAEGAVRERIASSQDSLDDDRMQKQRPKRRPSLTDVSVPVTFLANMNGTSHRPRVDLDEDLHSSAHNATHLPTPSKSNKQTTFAPATDLVSPSSCGSSPPHSNDINNSHDNWSNSSTSSGDDGDGGDSFCDASVQEQANEEYIKTDLGASCFWSEGPDDLADVEFQIDDEELQRHLVEIIAEEGLEEGMEAADAAALAEALRGLTSS
jgi:hypothetical protein